MAALLSHSLGACHHRRDTARIAEGQTRKIQPHRRAIRAQPLETRFQLGGRRQVEFAEQLLEQGRSITEAAIEAAELRLRPILMTSIAFILGVGPLYFATGAGSYGRHSVGTAIIGGMVLSTILNLFFIPVLYVVLKTVLRKFSGSPKASVVRDRELSTR